MSIQPILSINAEKYLLAADQTREMMPIAGAIFRSIKECGVSLQQVEKFFREKNSFTYIIARKRNESHTDDLDFMINNVVKTYYIFLSTRHPEIAIKELLVESNSYEENFVKLADAGFITAKKTIPLSSQFKAGKLEYTKNGLKQEFSSSSHV